ncbi:hypothetical protein [Streptomyces poonensis]|uniref:Uncharacterized protein n=1 Tax=Streptomyces poonensis TaxID=68255 RepID=A0A918UXS4_9ACTN|nr:hypothetical protein [Streptomyces poonensis]GGZ40524.1 hypothetical protein GCM10010365_71600 [Streptomyces poonensis]GLJ93037.1 hypothetical protein GCM10017589_56490 [Streptomyces poonensis]
MAVIDHENEAALDATRDRYGRTIRRQAAAAAIACWNNPSAEAYATYLAEHAGHLLDAARALSWTPHRRRPRRALPRQCAAPNAP